MDNDTILEILKMILPPGLGGFATAILLLLIIFILFPDKVEKWQAILWGWVESLGLFYERASKERIKHSIQSEVSDFTKALGYELPEFHPPGLRIEWVEENVERKAFIDGGKAVIRLRREEPNNENIVTACMMFISQVLLRKSVRYLSPTQREAVQLFVGYKMLSREDDDIYDTFIHKWLFPGIEKHNVKVSDYFERFHGIDNAELFLPVFLQELIYMGEKVFGRRRDEKIMMEVDSALQFLEVYASRKIGENVDRTHFNGDVCSFAIMIIGLSINIEDERYEIYLKHIKETLIPCGVETIYMIGPFRNISFMREIASLISDEFSNPFTKKYSVILLNRDGEEVQSTSCLSVLRRKQIIRYIKTQ